MYTSVSWRGTNVTHIEVNQLRWFTSVGHNMSTPTLRGGGSTYCFTDVRVGICVSVTAITKGTPAQFFGGSMFFGHGLLIFCYDLDRCSQGQAVRAFFIRMGFSLILSKVQGGF